MNLVRLHPPFQRCFRQYVDNDLEHPAGCTIVQCFTFKRCPLCQ
jgi:hypothetical protein